MFFLCIKCVFRVDYGHEEVRVKFGDDPRKYSTLTKEFLDDGKLVVFFLILCLYLTFYVCRYLKC